MATIGFVDPNETIDEGGKIFCHAPGSFKIRWKWGLVPY